LDACPDLTFAFEILGKRWSALVLDLLGSRPARFNEIRRAVPGLSDKMLTERLAELMENALVARTSENGSSIYWGADLLEGDHAAAGRTPLA
jgi:DNA-binding HxlR family transcriptional regulator